MDFASASQPVCIIQTFIDVLVENRMVYGSTLNGIAKLFIRRLEFART